LAGNVAFLICFFLSQKMLKIDSMVGQEESPHACREIGVT